MEGYDQPQVAYIDPRLDTEKFIVSDENKDREPFFSVGEVAHMVFGRSTRWLRLHEPRFEIDGEPMEVRRSEAGQRQYTFWDVERIAHSLTQQGIMDGQHLHHSLIILRYLSYLWNYP